MTDYSEHLLAIDKLKKQLRDALLKNHHTLACDLSMMLLTEARLLSVTVADLKRETESRTSCATSFNLCGND